MGIWSNCEMQSFEELTFRHAWTEEEEWARPDTSDLVNLTISSIIVVAIMIIQLIIIISKLILILFRSGSDQSPQTW